MILKTFVDVVLLLGLPCSGLCIASCIANNLEGESSPVSRRMTDNTATDLGLIFVGGEDSKLTVRVGLDLKRPKTLEIHFIYWGHKEIYFVLKTCCIISVLFSTKCQLFYSFTIFSSNNVCFINNVWKFKCKSGRLKLINLYM